MTSEQLQQVYALDYRHTLFTNTLAVHADCFEWMKRVPKDSVHAIVTDPPYGVKEYELDQLVKRSNGNGGIWRIPPSFDGHARSPLPCFTALNSDERKRLQGYFSEWATLVLHILRPGGHVFVASNAFLAQTVFTAISHSGFEFRGQVIRLVQTLRGGDRPKNAEQEFPDVCTMPRSRYEPWGLFRKPLLSGMTVADCLREYQTGGLRRRPDGNPFEDVIESERTPQRERRIANHPSLKPQSLLRRLIYASLPLGQGVVVDPFIGSGSTVAAAEALGYSCVGIERLEAYYEMSCRAIPELVRIVSDDAQLSLSLA